MGQLIGFSESATIAIHAMMYLAGSVEGRLVQLKDVAGTFKLSEAHLSKVMQRLGKAGLVRAVRGPQGGYALRRPPGEVSLLDIYEAIEGAVVVSSCLFGRQVCSGATCDLGTVVSDLHTQLRDYMARTMLGDVVGVRP